MADTKPKAPRKRPSRARKPPAPKPEPVVEEPLPTTMEELGEKVFEVGGQIKNAVKGPALEVANTYGHRLLDGVRGFVDGITGVKSRKRK